MSAPVSHSRGGAGNISKDDTKYVDGEIVRTGVEGSHGDGAFSTGRGGAANIGDSGTKAAERADKDVVPESAYRASQDNIDHHTGRGGAGNEHLVHDKKEKEKKDKLENTPKSLADKLKGKIMGVFKK